MRTPAASFARRRAAALFAVFLLGAGCREVPRPGNAAGGSSSPVTARTASYSDRTIRDLSLDEAAGGHTLRKHVGRTDDQLRERLRHEREISAASTWTDRETAQRAVGLALAQNDDRIQRWLARESHANLALDYDSGPTQPLGRTLRRDSDQPEPCSHATIVLKWSGPGSYYVLTSYPECRS